MEAKPTDILNQNINQGDVIVWTRGTKIAWTCLGVVDSISNRGTIYAKIVKSGKHYSEEGMIVRLGRCNSCVVVNDSTVGLLIHYKMKYLKP